LVTFVVTQNLGSIVVCQLKRFKGRASHSSPLTRLNWRALLRNDAASLGRSMAEAQRSAASIDGIKQAHHNRLAL
jgi:hypothetical protein